MPRERQRGHKRMKETRPDSRGERSGGVEGVPIHQATHRVDTGGAVIGTGPDSKALPCSFTHE